MCFINSSTAFQFNHYQIKHPLSFTKSSLSNWAHMGRDLKGEVSEEAEELLAYGRGLLAVFVYL